MLCATSFERLYIIYNPTNLRKIERKVYIMIIVASLVNIARIKLFTIINHTDVHALLSFRWLDCFGQPCHLLDGHAILSRASKQAVVSNGTKEA
jgi:hypothetical protein